jgi:predicted membrane protein DUF2232
VTSIAEPAAPARGGSIFRTLVLVAALGLFAWQTPMPWGGLWLMVPLAVAVSLLTAWRWGGWGVLAPVALFAAAMTLAGPFSIWVWWIPIAALTGAWMGLREEGGGPTSGQRAWTLLPVLLLAALLPWMANYTGLITNLDHWLRRGDPGVITLYQKLGYQGERLKAIERALPESIDFRTRILPTALPTVVFLWMVVLVSAGRGLAGRLARRLRWPDLSAGSLTDWRLPDGAVWLLLLAMALLVAGWSTWAASAWTLLINVGLGYCVQGVAVVESLLLARGVPPSIIALTLVFVFAMATPVFLLATVCVGVSDVWLDYRRLEAVPDGD